MRCGQLQSTRRHRMARLTALAGIILVGCETQRLVSDPTDPQLARLEITPAAITMQKDEVADLYGVGLSASGDSAEITVTWTATGGTIDPQSTVGHRHHGRYRAGQTCGTYAVIATGAPGEAADTAEISIVCAPAAVASVDVTPASASISVGATQQLTATPKAADGSALVGRTVTWATTAPGIATVNQQGLVTAIAAGSATITATSEGRDGSSGITVSDGGPSSLITDPSLVFSVPTTSKPAYLSPIRPEPFGTTITRIADTPGATFTTTNGSGTWGSDARHHYQKDQPWNATGTLIALENKGGNPGHVFLDGETYIPTYRHCSNYSQYDDRWHPSRQHANERINVNSSQLMWFDVVTCVKTRSWTLPFSVRGIGMGEGNASADGRFVALSDGSRMFLVDMDPQAPYAPYPSSRIGPTRDLNDCGLSSCSIDWVSVSPSGRYVVVVYNGDYLRVYDVNPGTLALTPRPMPVTHSGCHGTAANGFIYDVGHADMALNPFDNNEDVIVGQEHCGNRGKTVSGVLAGGVMMVRLRDGAITPLTHPANETYPHHISARNYERPGWVYVTYYPDAGKRFNDEIIAVRMDGSFAVERLAHTHSDFSGCYRCESHGVPSPDGKRVIFASNWCTACGSGCGSSSVIQAYVVDTR